jgi:hypothetical protein
VVGAGFLVDGEQHIFTCAHVVTASLGLFEDTPDAPHDLISLDFPLIAPKKLLTAKIVYWQPRQEDESGDIAVLQLQEKLPEEAEAPRFAQAEDFWEHPFRAFGFPAGQDDGVWATGRLLGAQATNWIMIEDVKTQGFAVMQGFSGAPVWDMQLRGVVGMVVASTTNDTKTAFIIPLDVLGAAWEISSPELSQRIFLSSAPDDITLARQLSTDLQERGIVVWSEQSGPDVGTPISEQERLQRAVRSAQAVMLIVSPQTRSSLVVKKHLDLATQYSRQLILVWVGEDSEAKPRYYGWRETTWINFHETPYPSILETIISSLNQDRPPSITGLLGPTDDKSQAEPRNPYKGLDSFTAEDTQDFFGRDRLVNELVGDVQKQLTMEEGGPLQERLLTLIGPSGSGKSSVLMAGLLPRLQYGSLSNSTQWIYLKPMVPGKHPIEVLALILKPYFPDTSIKTLREDLEDDATRGLHLLATQLTKKSDEHVIVLIDQFEELFTQTETESERQQFISLLVTAATEPRGPVLVLLTLRADFYGHPAQYPQLNHLIQANLRQVVPMEIEDLRATIERPGRLPDVGLTFEGNLVGDLLFEIQGQVGALPLLQFTLHQLFQRRNGHRLTLQAYHEIGGVKGALLQHAEKTYEGLSSEAHRKLARALFLRLIEPGATEQDTTRRRAALTEFELDDVQKRREMRETIDAFVKARLLTIKARLSTTNTMEGPQTIEVSHEIIIREWDRLATWVREARDEDIPLQQSITKDTEEWERRGKARDQLYRGTRLKDAQAWAGRNLVSKKELAFLRASAAQSRWRVATNLIVVLLFVSISTIGFAGITFLQRTFVTNTNDSGPGSLHDVIESASSGDTIRFSPFLSNQIIKLQNNVLIDKNLNIDGSNANNLTIMDNPSSLVINSGAIVSIFDLSFNNGVSTAKSSLVNIMTNDGNLSLIRCYFKNNTLSGNVIANNSGTLTITDSVISNNHAHAPFSYSGPLNGNTQPVGGSIIYNEGTLTIKHSIISNNTSIGGGPDNGVPSEGNVIANKTVVEGKVGTFTIEDDSKIIGNSVSGSNIYNASSGLVTSAVTLNVTNSTIDNNTVGQDGGGIKAVLGTVVITKCMITNNHAAGNGGGIEVQFGGNVQVKNSTIKGNYAAKNGGGIAVALRANAQLKNSAIFNSTIEGNRADVGGGGIAVAPGANVQVQGSTIKGNHAASNPDISGKITFI